MRWPFLLVALLPSTADAAEPPPSFEPPPCSVSVPAPQGPEVDVRAFGAVGDGVHDDTSAIENAITASKSGGVVRFGPGTYRHNRVLIVGRPGVTLTGRDATLLAGNPSQAAIFLSGDGSSLQDINITSSDPGARGNRDETSGVAVMGRGNAVLRARVSKSKSAGIIVLGAQDFLIACSTVSDTKADGIHVTRAAHSGRVLSNTVWNSEDDGIAVVSYRRDRQASRVVIEGNSVGHIRWGRGISVVGSKDIVIRRNTIRSVAMAAGIIVAREAFWNTHGAENVLIEGNDVSDIQLSLAPLDGRERTAQAAIDINSDDPDPALAVTDVRIVSNVVRGSGYDGIRLNGNVRRISIAGNDLQGIKRANLTVVNGPPDQRIACDGTSASPEVCAID